MPAKPDAQCLPWPITSVPPPLGARAESPDNGTTALRFTLADDGGRGEPRRIAAVPVRRIDTSDGLRWGVLVGGTPQWPVTAEHVRATTRFFEVEPTRGRPALYRGVIEPEADATAWLMLFVYSQCGTIGAGGGLNNYQLRYPIHIDGLEAFGVLANLDDAEPRLMGPTHAQLSPGAKLSLTRHFGVDREPATASATQSRTANPAQVVLPNPFIERVFDAIFASIVLRFERATTAGLRQAVIEVPARAPLTSQPQNPNQQRRAPPAPAPAQSLVFALASCQYAAGLLDRAPRFDSAFAGPAQASWQRLAARLDAAETASTGSAAAAGATDAAPAFIVLAGDQVYVDATAGLFDPRQLDDRYRAPYENLYAGRHVQDVLRRLPALMLIDDHEIDDNWAPRAADTTVADPNEVHELPRETRNETLRQRGVAAYRTQQRGLLAEGPDKLELWQAISLGGFEFFLGDTRVNREARGTGTLGTAKIMDDDQWLHLCGWLTRAAAAHDDANPPRPCFVATPSMLLPRRLATTESPAAALRSDAWDGYPVSLNAVLAHICDMRLGHVVFLSGDEHLSCIAEVTLTRSDRPGESVTFQSIHSSALYAPYPFANASEYDFAGVDGFDFDFERVEDGVVSNYHCDVTTTFVPGDGFALVHVAQQAGVWALGVEFDRADGVTWVPPKPRP